MPTGTVSLLFSDIEGSTALVKRLGGAYAEALDVQRQVLRRAWVDHGGTELGTEGDSFFVAFPTAEAAVVAASTGQRNLSACQWPAAERVRVRMGVHTGSPTVHDNGYVGMDVHRAARIAAAAHGGQVLVSEPTANLSKAWLPNGVRLRDLGLHQMKDLPEPERLFQLTIEGLQSDFPPLRTLGTTSSLPRGATPLVGRDGQLAELAAMLSSPHARLVTLTGPGGSGKTRLSIGAAELLVDRFPDGIHFVPLAAVTTADVMWTTIAEVIGIPPEGRTLPSFFDHVAHQRALLVLDNLEQIVGADDVVAELLDKAPEIVVIATSRRPLNLPGEVQRAVPPLDLPAGTTLEEAERSSAVQMFVWHAKAVNASFAMSAANAAAVAQLCRRLDGLPLALELAAARTKVLSASALLARLDMALDLAAPGSRAPVRQKTLRDTIAWSYQLLDSRQQAFLRRIGVFAGGADLDALAAVAADILDDATDPLDLIAGLVDASLVSITEDYRGEPRVSLLETIRSYALDQLRFAGELDRTRLLHAEHFLLVVHPLQSRMAGSEEQVIAARRRFELEHDNFRQALTWALQECDRSEGSSDRISLGVKLCRCLADLWADAGYLSEAQKWLEHVTRLVGEDGPDLASCLNSLANVYHGQGQFDRAAQIAAEAVAVEGRLGRQKELASALKTLGYCEDARGDHQASQAAYLEALGIAVVLQDRPLLGDLLTELAVAAMDETRYEEALYLASRSLTIYAEVGREHQALSNRLLIAETVFRMGRIREAHTRFTEAIPSVLRFASLGSRIDTAEVYSCVLGALGDVEHAARLLAAASVSRERNGLPRHAAQETLISDQLNKTNADLDTGSWNIQYERGRSMSVDTALTEAHAAHYTARAV